MKVVPPLVPPRVCPYCLLPISSSFFVLLLFAAAPLRGQVCNDLSLVVLDEDCSVAITPDMVLEGVPNDSNYIVTLKTLSGVPIGPLLTAAHLGDTIRATVTDTTTGNSCWGLLVAADFLPPTLTCPNIALPCAVPDVSPAWLSAALGLSAAYPVVADNCGAFDLDFLDTHFDLDCADPQDRSARIQRIWTAVDGSGNASSCVQVLTLQRVHADDIIFPADTSQTCTAPNTYPLFTGAPYVEAFAYNFPLFGTATACELNIGFEDQVLTLCSGSYNVLRTWTVYDDCLPTSPDNPRKHIQAIAVQDKAGPVLQCPKDTLVSTDPFACTRTLDLPDVRLYDLCSGVAGIEAKWTVGGKTFAQSGFLSDFPANNYWFPDTLGVLDFVPNLPAGEVIRFTYIASDQCGNTSTCSFRVTVSDGVPPFPVCDEFTYVALGGSGESLVFAATFDDGSQDYCSAVRFKARRVEPNACQPNDRFFDQIKFCCADAGQTIAVVLRVYDVEPDTGAVSLTHQENHAGDCLVQVFVEDKLKPICKPPAHTNIACQGYDPTLKAHGSPVFVDNCCLDTVIELAPNYALFDTLCNRGTIIRTFRAYDCTGLSSQCTQRVVVQYVQHYAIQFPDDVFVNDCDTTGVYGTGPIIYGEDCEQIGISYVDDVNTAGLLACYWIERHWRVVNWCRYDANLPFVEVPNPNPALNPLDIQNIPGPVVAPHGHVPAPTLRRVTVTDPMPTDFSSFWAAESNGYTYRQTIVVRDDQPPKFRGCPEQTGPVEMCDHTTNDPNYWNAGYWKNLHVPGSTDMSEGLANLAATANDACSKGNLTIRYMLYLDLDHDGVQETLINSINPPPAGMVRFGNALTPNFSGGVLQQFDQRPVPPEEKYRFTILTGGFSNITGYVRWHTAKDPTQYIVPQLPHGDHRIRWIADDGCGNQAHCEYTIRVRDCRAPELICLNGLSTDMPLEKTITLYAQDFLWDVNDNCTPANHILLGLRKSDGSLGFPSDPDGKPIKSVRFDCSELGKQDVELWAMDYAGNMSVCQTYVLVQDHFSMCSGAMATVAGVLQTANAEGLEAADVALSGGTPPVGLNMETDHDGGFSFTEAVPSGSDVTITPGKDNDPLNGVSTFDLSLINKHILGLAPLNSPHKLIAADVNNSRSVTTLDVVELRKLILGIYTDFPKNTSWRFVDAGYVFPNPSNPFQEIFPETRQLANLTSHALQENFTAVKIGDVSGNALTNTLLVPADRSTGQAALLDVAFSDARAEGRFRAGELFELSVRAAEPLLGYQFTLAHPGLEVVDITPGEGMRAEHFAVFPGEGILTVSWDGPGKPEFTVRFRAAASGTLERMLHLSSRVTRAEAYGTSGENGGVEIQNLALRFGSPGGTVVKPQGFELYPNEPNPWHDRTRVRFYLPEAGAVTLAVYDPTGRQIFSQTRAFGAGFQSIGLDGAALPAGVFYYRVETAAGSAGGKMVRG